MNGFSSPHDWITAPPDDAELASRQISATPFALGDPSEIPVRRWTLGDVFCRQVVAVTAAGGGSGKTARELVNAVAMATGQTLLNDQPHGQMRVWIYNLEDPMDEIRRRLAGVMQHYSISAEDLGGRLFVDSGLDRPLVTATEQRGGAIINAPLFDNLKAEILERGIDHLTVDPFVSSHRLNENDNSAIDAVAKQWARLAYECDISINLVHHVRKTDGKEATIEAQRGAKALTDAARKALVINRLTPDRLEELGEDPRATISCVTDGKSNLSQSSGAAWFKMKSVTIANGEAVGVAVPWKPPGDFDGLTTHHTLAAQRTIDEADPMLCRTSDQTDGWAGHLIAPCLGMNSDIDRKKIKRILGEWLKTGVLRKGEIKDEKSNPRPVYEVGEWINL